MKFVIFIGLVAIQCFQADARSRLGIHDLLFSDLRPLEAGTFTCPEPEGFYAIPDYCGPDYYVCISGSPYVKTCPGGAIFDPLTLTCTPIDSASCTPSFTCPSSDGFYAIPGSCSNNFYSCVGGTAYLEKCPGNSIFDPLTLVCTPPESVSCRASSTTTTTTTTTTTQPTTTASSFTCPSIDGFYPIPGECTGQYYVCIAGNLYIQKCPGTSIFDPDIGICVPAAVASCTTTTPSSTTSPTTTTSPSTTSTTTRSTTTTISTTPTTTQAPTSTSSTTTSSPLSNSTTSTSSTTIATTTKPSTTTFTPSTTTSTTTTPLPTTTMQTTTMPTTTITPPTDFSCPAPFGLYPVPGETCSPYFYHCSNTIPYLKSCPATTYFNPELEVCDYPENIPGCQ